VGNIKLVGSKRKEQQQKTRVEHDELKARKRPKGRKKRSTVKTIFTTVLIILLVAAGLLISLGFYVRSIDTVFPNVWAEGIDLSGMTLEEATRALIAAGYENNAEDVSVTVKFPNGDNFTIYGEEVGFALDAREAAVAAFQFGRNGSSNFENEITFVRSFFSRTDLNELSAAGFDEAFVRGTVVENTRQFNLALIEAAYVIGDESITIEVGTGVKPADEEAVFAMTVETLFLALEQQAQLTVEYLPAEAEASEIDLQLLFNTIHIDVVSSEYDPDTFSATESIAGKTFDLDAAMVMLDNAVVGDVIEIPLIFTEPEMSQEELNNMIFRDVLAERSTNVGGTAARRHNVAKAAELIHETKLNPGEVFSFNDIVGRRTEARGFRPAGAFASGRLIDLPGGGICQTSSTIYWAVLHSNLEVLERHPHGLTVGYIPLGHDATIVWGERDLRFRNDREFPIKIDVTIENYVITARIIGTRVDDYTFTTDFITLQSTPVQVIRRVDNNLQPGQQVVDLPGQAGVVVEVFMNRLDADGEVVDRWSIGRSRYNMQNRIIYYGPSPDVEEPDPEEGQVSPEEQQTPPDGQTPPPSDGQASPGEQTPPPSDEHTPPEEQTPPSDGQAPPEDPTPQPPPQDQESPDDQAPVDLLIMTPPEDNQVQEHPPGNQDSDSPTE